MLLPSWVHGLHLYSGSACILVGKEASTLGFGTEKSLKSFVASRLRHGLKAGNHVQSVMTSSFSTFTSVGRVGLHLPYFPPLSLSSSPTPYSFNDRFSF